MGNELIRSDWYQKHQQQLQSSWSDIEFVRQTIAQIDKDFAKFNVNISEYLEIDENTKEKLLGEMSSLLQQLSNHSPHQFTQLIYTIDLPENIFKALLNQNDHFFENLASCILLREAYKVFLRSKY